MADNFNHLSHKKSRLTREITSEEFFGLTPTEDNSDAQGSSPVKLNLAKRPTSDKLVFGEIAVNYLKGHETLTIMNTAGEIVGFVNENDYMQSQEIIASAMAQEKTDRMNDVSSLMSEIGVLSDRIDDIDPETDSKIDELREQVEGIDERVTQNTADIAAKLDKSEFDAFKSDVDDMELTVSASLNDLNSRIINNKDRVEGRLAEIDGSLDSINTAMDGMFDGVAYDSTERTISFKNGDDVIAVIDAADFIKDGMVQNVEISGGNLVITFNTDAGRQPISIPLADIFDPSNYYDKNAVDTLLSGKADSSDVYTKTETDALLEDYVTKESADIVEHTVSASLNDLNSRIIANKNIADSKFSTKEELSAVDAKADENSSEIASLSTALNDMTEAMEDNELIISSSLNDLNTRVLANNTSIQNLLSENAALRQTVEGLLQTISDLTSRIEALEQ